MISSGSLIRTDYSSFTAYGEPWIAQQWLGECAMALGHRLAGFDGLLVMTVALIAFLYAWVARRFMHRGLHFLLAMLIVALALAASSHSFHIRPHMLSILFLGLAFGQLFFGPLSDKTGRKPAIYAGYAVYITGALLSVFAPSFPIMIVGRLLQGFGLSAPRAVSLALVRDRYEGRMMARVMSFVMTVFILVPMIAPSLGQAILLFFGWRSIFSSFVSSTWLPKKLPILSP